MKKMIITGILLAGLQQANAEELVGGYGACTTKELFDEFITAVVKKDETALNYLTQHGCIITKAGIKVSVLDTTWTGTAKVRAYTPDGQNSAILWTNTENIKR